MKIELDGIIWEGGEYGYLCIGDSGLASIMEDTSGEVAKLTYYISNEPIDKDRAVENYLRAFYEGLTEVDREYCHGTSWTGVYGQNDEVYIGGHDIVSELHDHKGKYCYLIIETLDSQPAPSGDKSAV